MYTNIYTQYIYTRYFILIFTCDLTNSSTLKKKFQVKIIFKLVLKHSERYLLNINFRRFLLCVFQNHSKLFTIYNSCKTIKI